MDFFEHQDRARRNSQWLILYFLAAIVMIVLSVYLAAVGVVTFIEGQDDSLTFRLWHPELFAAVVTMVLLVIVTGSLYKITMIGSGGEHVALSLGGRKVPANTQNLDERILLNVVEEMALASGTQVPPVYVMDDELGINAFAAGTTPQNAVIGVTRGTLETMNREELQGVIAHEFSHILNGDMRLNIRLMGLLHGILIIALIGYWIFRLIGNSSSGRSSNDKKGEGALIIAIMLFGGALMIIGYVGVFFSQLIKSAVSRQREYLADASAVQFTRNPEGIAGALKKIGGWKPATKLNAPRAEEASHMFFGQSSLSSLFATHPPLVSRIQRVDPQFQGAFRETRRVEHTAAELIDPRSLAMSMASSTSSESTHRAEEASHVTALAGARALSDRPTLAVEQTGEPDLPHLHHAHDLVEGIDARLADDVRDPLGAVATVCGLLMAPAGDPNRSLQYKLIQQRSAQIALETTRIQPSIDAVQPEQRLAIVCLALPALLQLSASQIQQFHRLVIELIEVDRRISLFEYAVQRFIRKRLLDRLESKKPAQPSHASFAQIQPAFITALSTLAHRSGQQGNPQAAFEAGWKALPSQGVPPLLPVTECTFQKLEPALDQLEKALPRLKKKMLLAFSACIAADDRVTIEEAELLRVFADALGCPTPPLIQQSPT